MEETAKHRVTDLGEASFKAITRLRDFSGLFRGKLNKQQIRNAIYELGVAMEYLPQCEQELEHLYADGIYGRKWSCAKGNIIVTEIHTVQHISSLIKGKMVVASPDGMKILEAPQFFVTEPGTQRVLLVIEDAVFTTVHANPTGERDPDKLKKMFTVRTFAELPALVEVVQ